MKGGFKSLLRKFCLDGSLLGVKYFYLFSDKISRCFWLAFLTFVLYFALVLTYLLYKRFDAMPTRITIENQFEPAAELPLPAITLCTPNQLTLSGIRHFDKTLVNGNRSNLDLVAAFHELLGFYYFVNLNDHDLAVLQNLVELNRYTVPEVMSLLPQSCDAFLQMCIFRKQYYPRCKGFFRPILTKHGLCCIFNSAYYYKSNRRNERDPNFEPYPVKRSGLMQGLVVITDFQPEDAADRSIHFAGSTRVMFTDWTEFPADDETVLAAPATESFYFIRATTTYCSKDVKELSFHSRKCAFEDEYQLPYFRRYRNSDCDMLCLARAVEARCHCTMFYVPHLRTGTTCPFTAIPCITDTKLKLNDWLQHEKCECPRDCDSRAYHTDVTFGNLNALPYMHIPYKGYQFNESSSIMHFFFPVPVYEKQKQETVMSYTTLASNLGGVFGLCMGVSVITMLEIIFYYYTLARNSLHTRLRKRQRRERQRSFYYE